MLPIARKKKPDWGAIKAEYIGGGISQRELSIKHGVSFNTLSKRANDEKWAAQRKKAYENVTEKAQRKTADAKASNAVKLEMVRAELIDKLYKIVKQIPEKSGTHIRQSQTDKQTGKQLTVDYELAVLVTMFEKLSTGATADLERQKQFAEENNTTLMTYADLFRRVARTRTLEDIESGGGTDV